MTTRVPKPSSLASADSQQRIAQLEQENAELRRALDEGLARETATGEVLRVIASSPTDIQEVLDTVAESSARLCEAIDAEICRVDGELLRWVAHFGPMPTPGRRGESQPIARESVSGRAVLERRTIHVHDLQNDPELSIARTRARRTGTRTVVSVPLLREGAAIGTILARRNEVRPFTERQIALLETFADQAVIAIENAQLFEELADRNRQVTEALEQQTATSEVLRVIAGSPTEIQTVLDAVVESAARLCGASDAGIVRVEGDMLRIVASVGQLGTSLGRDDPTYPIQGSAAGQAVIEGRTIQIADLQAAPIATFSVGRERAQRFGFRTQLTTPLLRDGSAIGAIMLLRRDVRPFSNTQVALLETFADQAVIAIENTRLFQELEDRNKHLAEALEQQTATSEVLRVIASSPTDLQTVLDTVSENAARLCGAVDASIDRVEGATRRRVAKFGSLPTNPIGTERPVNRGSVPGRALVDRRTVHVHDILAESEAEYPESRGMAYRTSLATPLLREGVPIGVILMWRAEVEPFTERQIALLETFADQAVIAIENTRLFQELEDRNKDLAEALGREREALEQQTATGEVLRVIASSPTDLQTVLDTLARTAATLCSAHNVAIRRAEGDQMRLAAAYGPALDTGRADVPLTHDSMAGRAFMERRTIHAEDLAVALDEYPEAANLLRSGFRTHLVTPLLREGRSIGTLAVRRTKVQPFSPQEIALLETFADQAVIAIENTRLFQELEDRNKDLAESLEQQTATGEILRVIASSPTDLPAVLETIVQNAARLCDAYDVSVGLVEGDAFRIAGHYGPMAVAEGTLPLGRGSAVGRAVLDRRTIHVEDVDAYPPPHGRRLGGRTMLVAPLLRENAAVGFIALRRTEVRPFSPQEIALLETFSDQAVIAIENTRLFQELEDRNKDLAEALEQQTATGEVLRVIASSPTDLQAVLDTLAKTAARLCDASSVVIRRAEGDQMRLAAAYGSAPDVRVEVPLARGSMPGRAFIERRTIHVEDLAEAADEFPESGANLPRSRIRTNLVTPLLREGRSIGTLAVRRTRVQPFSPQEIALLETFADQAVIAIENTRLFQELQDRNKDLAESLEQQTATSEVLRVIASSPTDLQTVLDTVSENAARLCEADDAGVQRIYGDKTRWVSHYGSIPTGSELGVASESPITPDWPSGRVVIERRTIHIHDLALEVETAYPTLEEIQRRNGVRTMLLTPLLREGVPIGVILIRRLQVRPFSEKHIALIETFADQAVIAIENTRLFGELEERTRELARSVEELQALGEVGQVVGSTLELQQVLTTVLSHAVQLSGTDGGSIYEYDAAADAFIERATQGIGEEVRAVLHEAPLRLGEGLLGRAAAARQPVQVGDILEEGAYEGRLRETLLRAGYRAVLAVPLLREEQVVGGLVVRRGTPGEVPPELVDLLKTFASQSALAIQNARLFEEIEEKSAQLEMVSRHKSEFLANMSHELRTPLNAIIGFSEVLTEKLFGDLNDKQEEYLRDILASGQHLLSLINDILDLSKVEAGQMELEVSRFSLPEALENGLTMIKERAGRHGIALGLEVDPELGEIEADERKVKQVLFNLLSNAVKFTPDGGRIDVSARSADGAVELAVRDTGVGIAPDDQERIFEEFRQVGAGPGKPEGTGLGLALTRKLVELHGGRIWVESQIGCGSTFTFTLQPSG